MNGAQARSENMPKELKDTASLVIAPSALALLGGILAARVPPMGEMGDFMYVTARVIVCSGVWGLATGIGLLRKWRWARISMLVFGGILVTFGVILPVVMMLPLEEGKFVGWATLLTWQSIVVSTSDITGCCWRRVTSRGGCLGARCEGLRRSHHQQDRRAVDRSRFRLSEPGEGKVFEERVGEASVFGLILPQPSERLCTQKPGSSLAC